MAGKHDKQNCNFNIVVGGRKTYPICKCELLIQFFKSNGRGFRCGVSSLIKRTKLLVSGVIPAR